jgi:HKD family nuclease
MKVEFLGHGLHDDCTNTVGDWLCSTFKDSDYFTFIGFSAFTKMSGINRIKEELLIAKKNYKSVRFYLGIVEYGTSKEALDFFINNDIETWIYCTDKAIMFHPKIFYFYGKHNSRFILGSSNLTSAGLFDNIEASTLFEFSHSDSCGKKFIRQYQNYFSPIIEGEDKYTIRLTPEVLTDLIASGFVADESNTVEGFDTNNNKNLHAKRKFSKYRKEDIGHQQTTLNVKKYHSENYIPEINDAYMNSWSELFELFKEFKQENTDKGERYSVTVPSDYKNPTLYRWYRLQKIYFKNKMLPHEHFLLLREEKFYFKDAHILWQEFKEEQKLEILLDALIDGEDIKLNHRYIYKGHHIGTWLVGVNQANKKGKKLKLRQQILELGFDISAFSRTPEESANRFLSDLLEAENPEKMNVQNRFNGTILNKIDTIPDDILQDIVDAWYIQFNEIRPLGKIREKQKDRTDEWKAFRYDKKINPEGKWLSPLSLMGDVFWWARSKRESKQRMSLITKNFNEKEKVELRNEGFSI